ncbi:FxDxF family PEP-CTERM protein [Chitinimonas arctica]|nr:FxDxF family PEP-CTERM protein [Chitinimonas arctica]
MNLAIKKLAVAVAIIGSGAAAQAQVIDIGVLTDIGDYTHELTFAAGAQINDTWNFSLDGGNNQFFGVLSKINNRQASSIGNFAATLFGPNGATAWTYMSTNKSQILSYDGALSSGAYSLVVTGLAGTIGGKYAIEMNASADPIPEPETYAMFLAGIGLIGTIARRRSKNQA